MRVASDAFARPIAAGCPPRAGCAASNKPERTALRKSSLPPKVLPPRLANRGCEVILMHRKTGFSGPENSLPEPAGLRGMGGGLSGVLESVASARRMGLWT